MSKNASAFDGLVGEMEDGLEPEVEETSEANEQPESAETAAESEPEAPATEEPETEDDGEAEPETEPEAAPAAEEEPAAEPAEPASAEELAAKLAEQEKAQKRLREEVVKYRTEARMAQAKLNGGQAPNPAAPAQAPQAQTPAAEAGEDGLIWENGRARVDPAFIEKIVEARTRPDPQTIAAQREEGLRRSFIGAGEGAEDRAASYSRADEVMETFNYKMFALAQQSGADLSQMGVEGILTVARDTGVMAEIEAAYPDVAPHVPDLLIAGTLPQGHGDLAMRNTLSRYHEARTAQHRTSQGPVSPQQLPNTAKQAVRSDRPPSTARSGQPPTGDNASSKTQREEALTDKLAADPMHGLTKAEADELKSLRAELGL